MTALTVLATTASGTPRTGPNSRPAASVNAVRGNGKTVTTMWAARNANGNHGPTEVAQSRSSTAVGNGTSHANAMSITTAARKAKNRRGGTCEAVVITEARSARTVSTTAFTATKTTGRRGLCPTTSAVDRLPTARGCDGDHLA